MPADYYRVELAHCLAIDEVALRMMIMSNGRMQEFEPKAPKMTDGVVDEEGRHYSAADWEGRIRSGTGSGPGKKITIGITDYEYFGNGSAADRKACGRRGGHRHFFAKGTPKAVAWAIDIFKASIPSTLWRDEKIPREVHDYYYYYYYY